MLDDDRRRANEQRQNRRKAGYFRPENPAWEAFGSPDESLEKMNITHEEREGTKNFQKRPSRCSFLRG
jgi:hypothetical protein